MKQIIIATICLLAFCQYSSAQADTVEAIILNSDSLEAGKLYNSGITKFKAKNFDGALADFSKAIELRKGFHSAYLNRGSVYMEQKDYSKAISDYNV